MLLILVEYRRSNMLGNDQEKINKTEKSINQKLAKKYPRCDKVLTVVLIAWNYVFIILAFIGFLVLLISLRISILNLVSLSIVISLLFIYLNDGL